jgi:DNA-binding beta-propeller fold protein YncE
LVRFSLAHLLAMVLVGSGAFHERRAEAAGHEPLALETIIPLDGVAGRIDHLAVDLKRRRLFVAELSNHTVDVVDLDLGRSVHRLGGLAEPQGIGYLATLDRLVVADGDGTVHLYDGIDLKPTGTVDLGTDADNVRLGPDDTQVIVGYGGGGLAIIDAASARLSGKVPLASHPEGFRLEPRSKRVFVNLPATRQIAVVSLDGMRQSARWDVEEWQSNFPMALDESGSTLASVFRKPARLALFDLASGSRRQDLATCEDADDVFFDDRRQRIYVSCGAGVIDVLERRDGHYGQLARIDTSPGARTSLFVPELDRLFVAARAGADGQGARILVFRPTS